MTSAGVSTGTLGNMPPAVSALPSLRHRRYSVDEYENLIRRGVLTENDRCELIRGVIVDKMGIGDLHTACVKRLNRLFHAKAASRFLVSIQDPIRLADSEPEPDCALVTFRDDFYSTQKPQAADVLLLVEVADSSLELDRGIKRSLYAEAGILEYWLVNVVDGQIEVFGRPTSGVYLESRILRRSESLAPAAFPDLVFAVEDILGPA